MDLSYDVPTLRIPGEVRTFLDANTDAFPTKSYDTAEGFEQHRHWDRCCSTPGCR